MSSFTFVQPTSDLHLDQPPPAASVVTAVNYDRSPSLVDLSATPNTQVQPCEFTSFAEAKAAYDAWLPGCNWGKPPTLKRFWYESEKHLTPGVDYVSWGFREHPHWVGVNNGEILERTEANEELIDNSGPLVKSKVSQFLAPEAVAALDRSAKIERETMPCTQCNGACGGVDAGNCCAHCNGTGSEPSWLHVEAIQAGLATPNKVLQPGEGPIAVDQSVAEAVASSAVIAITKEATAEPTPAVPTVRLKYTEEEYAELRRRAEEDYAIELQRKENQYAEISMARAKQEDVVKALKAEEKGQLESLRFLKSEGPKYPKNPEIKVVPPGANPTNQEGGSSDQPQPTSSDLDVSDERYQRYRALPLLPIVKDIKGLGSTKLATLVDQYENVGKLLDMMKEKGLQWYKAVGKGFGPELGTRIEDAVADALQKVE